jgi:hypothetical protein
MGDDVAAWGGGPKERGCGPTWHGPTGHAVIMVRDTASG